jgi:hypothetical protein
VHTTGRSSLQPDIYIFVAQGLPCSMRTDYSELVHVSYCTVLSSDIDHAYTAASCCYTHKQMMCSALEGSAAAVTQLLSQQQQQQQQQQQSSIRIAGTNTTHGNSNTANLCADQDEEDALDLLIKSLEVLYFHFQRISSKFSA